ncbi:MAG TPA: molybdopterin-dependent oxidoreductase [Stackebrandtia sp.]|jgi:DMSO/TMAO reductase YedYZ molybdopterin-dependent catalytic subunit|uniref:molybdopterin-dependent oxidoreductase n=1 Tax=Stackebrandtia sp. TaxID=2023065 RepID=UPI002D7360DA|nr:molybdopterin-dependent oxidoreductase [Stackebrandtia sp.]HZE38614.1 molybdopterin-dependent oxidoreductase [Stackebrandtia sp.]
MSSITALRRIVDTARNHRLSPFREGAFAQRIHHPRVATVIGRALAVCLVWCFLTGLYSHFQQDPASWMSFPTRPVWLYRVTQGSHVVSGMAAIPLVLAKLWTVYPRLFSWPIVRNPVHMIERGSIAVFVAATLLQLFMGFFNTIKWYVWPFSFRHTHYWMSWIIVGSLLIHIAVKLPLIHEHWRAARETEARTSGWSRRGFLATVSIATAAVVMTSAGQSFTPLGRVAVLAPRRPGVGPQGLPINRTAKAARIDPAAVSTDWRLEVDGPKPLRLSLSDLNAMPQTEVELPIACVEGWSQNARWGGVRIRTLLDRAGARRGDGARVTSLQRAGSYSESELPSEYAWDDDTLLALRLNGSVLHIDHGYPARIIAPGRPGVLQTKWVRGLEVRR